MGLSVCQKETVLVRASIVETLCLFLYFTDIPFFEKALKLQHSVHKDATAFQQQRHLGLLPVDKTQLKTKLVYSQLQARTSNVQTDTHNISLWLKSYKAF